MDWVIAGFVVMIAGTIALKWLWRRARPEPLAPSAEPEVPGTERRPMQLSDEVKAMYPDQGAQDAILRAWNTGKPAVWNRPHDEGDDSK